MHLFMGSLVSQGKFHFLNLDTLLAVDIIGTGLTLKKSSI